MATAGASGEKPPPVQTLAAAVHGSIEAKCEFNVDSLSKPELLTLLSIMEGELEARDLVIEALRARRKETFIQERYACFTLTDPFLALQRDGQPGGGDKEGRSLGASPISVLEAVMAHCRKMQERMSAQLAAAESRQKKLEQEKEQLQGLQQEHRRLTAQLKDEREKNKHIVTMLVRECRQLAARVVEESQRFEELSARLQEEGKAAGQLEEDLKAERRKGQQMEAQTEKQLSEMDVEREQLRACLGREEARCAELKSESEGLRRQLEELRTKGCAKAPSPTSASPTAANTAKATASVAVETEPVSWRAASCQTDVAAEFGPEGLKKAAPAKTPGGNYGTASLPKTGGMPRGPGYSCPGGLFQAENGPSGGESSPTFSPTTPIHSLHLPGTPTSSLPTGVSPRVQAARYKFQTPPSEQDQNGTGAQSPRSRDVSPSNRELVAKQQARHTVTQVLSRFTSGPAGGTVRPVLPHSTSEGGPFPGRLGHAQIKSPTSGKIDRGNPPPVPPKKPGLSQAPPSAPHPPIKVVGDGSRSPASGVGLPSKPATPMLPPKPALDLAGTGGASPVPALTASQVGARPSAGQEPQWAACAECHPVAVAVVSSPPINPVSASSCRPCESDRPLAAASGWTSSIAPSLPSGDPAPLADGCTPLLEAATQGNVTLLSMLLNPDPKDIIHSHEDTNAALFSAAQNGHTDCIKLLLAAGASAEASDANGLTPLHMAAAHGHFRCLELLMAGIADVNGVAMGGQSALFLAGSSGDAECVRALLDAGADRSLATADGYTALHAAADGGHVGCLEPLLYHPSPQQSSLLNITNRDGWTPAYIAAANGYKKCLELLCGHSPHDLEQRDACNRTIHHVATDDCKDLLENLYSYRVLVRIRGGSEEQICMVDVLEDGPTVGVVAVHRDTCWEELSGALTEALSSHFLLLTAGEDGGRDLGLSADSVSSVLIGNIVWNMDQEPSQSPWDLIRKCQCQHITVKLKGLQESSLDEFAYDSLIPLQLLNNYVRLVEQYRNVILHGLEGSCQGYIANQVSLCIKHRQEAMGIGCDIITVEMEEDLSKEQLLETFINCGFLVPVNQAAAGRSVVMILEGLEKVRSLSELLGDLCDSLETRGVVYPVPLLHAQEGSCLHHFQEGGFLIGTLSKPHLQGAELLLQHFRWVQLRWDSEPLDGLLTRHLRRKLVHKMKGQVPAPADLLWRTMAWVCSVWQQLNSCVSRLGTPEALMGPQMFLSCPVIPGQTQAVVKWLTRLWNLVVVPRVEEAVISRVTMRKSTAQDQSPANSNSTLSPSQQAVVKAALSILVNKAILQGCPLPRQEIDKHLAEFHGSRFPLSALGSYKGAGRRKGRDSAPWRRANTSPRKKSSPLSSWPSGSNLREGSLSTTDLHSSTKSTTPQSCADGEPSRFSLVSDDEADLMLQLQTMCSSKSEPDIRKIPPSSEDFIMFPGTRSGQTALQNNNEETSQTRAKGRCHSSSHAPGAPSSEKRTARPKSQLPIPSSKSLQGEQTTGTNSRTSSKTRQAPPSNNNNQSQDIWILQRDLLVNDNK